MKKLIILFLCITCLCAACGKLPSTRSDKKEFEELYSYATPFIFSQERIQNNKVEYIDGIDVLVEEAVEIVAGKMQKAHDTRDWDSEVWTVWEFECNKEIFDGKGFYICKIPITEYNNNRNRLWNTFTLFIFNEDKTKVGAAVFSDFDRKKLSVSMMPDALFFGVDSFAIAKESPDMEFINITANYKRGNPPSRPGLIGGEGVEYISASHALGENNKVYYYDKYSDTKVKELKISEDGNQWTVEGDVFHSLPKEMRYSYDKIMDNLIWVEYK